jgi:hypothetical protein
MPGLNDFNQDRVSEAPLTCCALLVTMPPLLTPGDFLNGF